MFGYKLLGKVMGLAAAFVPPMHPCSATAPARARRCRRFLHAPEILRAKDIGKRPALCQAIARLRVFHSKVPAPLLQCPAFAIHHKAAIGTFVIRLCRMVSPSAIARLIMTIYINSV